MNDKTPDILIGPLLIKLRSVSAGDYDYSTDPLDDNEIDYLIRLVEEDIDSD